MGRAARCDPSGRGPDRGGRAGDPRGTKPDPEMRGGPDLRPPALLRSLTLRSLAPDGSYLRTSETAPAMTTCLRIERPPGVADTEHLEAALQSVPGVASVEFETHSQVAVVHHEGADTSRLRAAVALLGYRADPLSA